MSAVDTFFFLVFPYMCITSFVVGHIWRYRYDKFGWTTRSSQWYESRLLRWASPMFHFGLLGVLLGHFGGLLIPESWTNALGINEPVPRGCGRPWVNRGHRHGDRTRRPHLAAAIDPAVFRATTKMDKAMYVVLGIVVALGLFNTIYWQILAGGYNYRETVSIWFRSIFYFNPDVTLIAEAPLSFQLHAIAAFSLFALWPFTRLVHVLSAPVGYLWRPYVVPIEGRASAARQS